MLSVTGQTKAFFEGLHEVHDRIEKIVYVPGNHDHHIWALHVEQDMVKGMEAGEVPNALIT